MGPDTVKSAGSPTRRSYSQAQASVHVLHGVHVIWRLAVLLLLLLLQLLLPSSTFVFSPH